MNQKNIVSKKIQKITTSENKSKKKYINNKLNNFNLLKEWWNSDLTDKIQIYDSDTCSVYEFAIENTNKGLLLFNKAHVILGEVNQWIDLENKIPKCFKNKDNKVIDPNSSIPILEYMLYENMCIYHNLSSKIYREYRYNSEIEMLYLTNCIKII